MTDSTTSNSGSLRPRRRQMGLDDYELGVLDGDRGILARAITLIESSNAAHRKTAEQLLTRLMPRTGGSYRVGVTGPPGVGKSTFIEALGATLTGSGLRVAVLAVDPSSDVTGGSILGDKTRMATLSADPAAFIRPSPSAGTLGGVARTTRETLLACEAAGYDVVLVETVGVGQSETMVADMTDFFLALVMPGAGDELQGMKRGIIELADMIAVNKADGDRVHAAKRAKLEYAGALAVASSSDDRSRDVVTCSAATGEGIEALWTSIRERLDAARASGELGARRRSQMRRWMWSAIDERMREIVRRHPKASEARAETERAVSDGSMLPPVGARRILRAMFGDLIEPEGEST